MTATAEPPARPVEGTPLNRAEGVELLGAVHGCGYRDGAALVRRADGQMVQLGQLMYGLLESVDGERDVSALAEALSERLGRRVQPEHVVRLAEKLAAQGLLAGTEQHAPPRSNPLLALRWKVLVTDPTWTKRLTTPFGVLFRPWVMWPVVLCFGGVFWFVLIHKGVASATSQAFKHPGLFLLVFALAVISAGFHELGHAAAARYGGATPGGMGVGLYLVWPAFYTDVTDAYRLPRRDRLRADLAGLYFNAMLAVVTMGVWLVVRADALLLLVALQVLQMVKQLSPVIRADGYHILSDATGVPDLYAHMGPTLKRLLPRHRREPSALSGWARALVTIWVLIVVPVLLALSLSAIILLPRLATSAWNSGRHIILSIPHQAGHGHILALLASLVSLVALVLPVLGSLLVTQKILRTVIGRAREWSRDDARRRALVLLAGAAVAAGAVWAWWPSGQYQPVRATQNGTIGGMVQLVSAPARVARPTPGPAPLSLTPGKHLAVAMIPVGGATKAHPAVFIVPGKKGKPAVAILSSSTPDPKKAAGGTFSSAGGGGAATSAPSSTSTTPATTTTPGTPTPAAPTTPTAGSSSSPVDATAFPFKLPAAPGPGGTQALAENTTNGGVTYDVAYALVTVTGGAPVTNTNSAYAIASCNACTTVAVSFQVVLVVGQSNRIVPINAAGALNYNCPACTTTAIADQIVVTLKSLPSKELLAKLTSVLQQLNALPSLGAGGSPTAVAAQVSTVQQQIENQLASSGIEANPPKPTSTTTTPTSTSSGQASSSSTGSSGTSGSSTSSPNGTSSGSQTSTTSSPPSSGTSTTTTPSSTTTTPGATEGSQTTTTSTTATGSSG
jgi:putative peptide zinc metalloprotease protein